MASDTEITKVRIVIRHLLWQIREVRKDKDAAWQWVNRFANTLQYQDLEQDPDQYALAILAEARSFNDQKQRNQQMRWVRKQLADEGVTNPTQEQLDEKWLEMYGQETTADGDTREDSQDRKSVTSADIYGDAGHREAPDESATVSTNMGRVAQNGTHPRIQGGKRAAQGAMSPSPSGAAQDGKISGTPEALVNQTRTGGPSLSQSPSSILPVRNPDMQRVGRTGHVALTKEQGQRMRDELGDSLERAIEILDSYIDGLPSKARNDRKNGARYWMEEYEAKDHYRIIMSGWVRERLNESIAKECNARAAERRLENANSASGPRQMYMTSDDISRRNAEEGWRQLQLMKGGNGA